MNTVIETLQEIAAGDKVGRVYISPEQAREVLAAAHQLKVEAASMRQPEGEVIEGIAYRVQAAFDVPTEDGKPILPRGWRVLSGTNPGVLLISTPDHKMIAVRRDGHPASSILHHLASDLIGASP